MGNSGGGNSGGGNSGGGGSSGGGSSGGGSLSVQNNEDSNIDNTAAYKSYFQQTADAAANADVSLDGGGDCGDCGRKDQTSVMETLANTGDALKYSEYAIAFLLASDDTGLINMNEKTMKTIKVGGKMVGRANYVGGALSVGLDYNSMKNDEISGERFAYRTSSTIASFGAAGSIGGWKGVLIGGIIGTGATV